MHTLRIRQPHAGHSVHSNKDRRKRFRKQKDLSEKAVKYVVNRRPPEQVMELIQ